MRLRDFMTLLGGSVAARSRAARAQQAAMPVIGFLSAVSREQTTHLEAAWRRGLSETGYKEGRNVAIEFRYADGHYDRLPALVAELVSRPVGLSPQRRLRQPSLQKWRLRRKPLCWK
jgi:putative ABC transport system substrate-binding protein